MRVYNQSMGVREARWDRTEVDGSRPGAVSTLQSVALEVRNRDISRHFYTEVLGMRELEQGSTGNAGAVMLQPCQGGSCIMLISINDQAGDSSSGYDTQPRLRWTGLSLATEDIDGLYCVLCSRNVQILQEPQTKPWGVRDCVFADPDGNVFNLVQQQG